METVAEFPQDKQNVGRKEGDVRARNYGPGSASWWEPLRQRLNEPGEDRGTRKGLSLVFLNGTMGDNKTPSQCVRKQVTPIVVSQ